MKRSLIISFLAINLCSFGQKRITALVTNTYEMNGDVYGLDSLINTYNYQQVGFSSVRPVFSYDETIHSYYIQKIGPKINTSADQTSLYTGVTYPLSFSGTSTPIYVNGLIIQSSSGGNSRVLYEYDSQGNNTKLTNELLTSGTWIPLDSVSYSYDSNGNRLTQAAYDVNTLDAITYTDTATYLPGTNHLTEYRTYLPLVFGGPLEPLDKTITTYNGTSIVNEDFYTNLGNSGLEWIRRSVYEHVGSQPTQFSHYSVQNNVVSAAPTNITLFEYNSQNLHSAHLNLTPSGDTIGMTTFEYDLDGFVTAYKRFEYSFSNGLYLSEEKYYYYESAPLGLETIEEITVLIYPNPTSDFVTVEATGTIERLQLLNLAGQVLLEQDSEVLDLRHLPSGNYMLSGVTNTGRFSKMLIKK